MGGKAGTERLSGCFTGKAHDALGLHRVVQLPVSELALTFQTSERRMSSDCEKSQKNVPGSLERPKE